MASVTFLRLLMPFFVVQQSTSGKFYSFYIASPRSGHIYSLEQRRRHGENAGTDEAATELGVSRLAVC